MSIPKTMRAAVVEKFREPLVLREIPVPMPGPAQALVEMSQVVSATLTCTRLTAIGLCSQIFLSHPDMRERVWLSRSAEVSNT
jgi:hypothetical protein